jgi:sulfur-oxidizing protein SoxY
MDRRRALQAGGGLIGALAAAGFIPKALAQAAGTPWNAAAFSASTLDEALRALGVSGPTQSPDIRIDAPEVSDTGSVVPVSVDSGIPGTEAIALALEKNATTLSAVIDLPPGTDPFVNLNLRMAESGDVVALVRAGGRYYYARRAVKLVQGGCGE